MHFILRLNCIYPRILLPLNLTLLFILYTIIFLTKSLISRGFLAFFPNFSVYISSCLNPLRVNIMNRLICGRFSPILPVQQRLMNMNKLRSLLIIHFLLQIIYVIFIRRSENIWRLTKPRRLHPKIQFIFVIHVKLPRRHHFQAPLRQKICGLIVILKVKLLRLQSAYRKDILPACKRPITSWLTIG